MPSPSELARLEEEGFEEAFQKKLKDLQTETEFNKTLYLENVKVREMLDEMLPRRRLKSC